MAQRLSEATMADYEAVRGGMPGLVGGCPNVQEAAQRFVELVYGRFGASLVLLRLFMTLRYDQLPEEDRLFVDRRGRDTNTSHLIHPATPIFTLLGSRGHRPEWSDRRNSSHFRCIPLASTAYVASLSMLSRQLESVGFDLGLIDDWDAKVAATGRADDFRGLLHINDAAADRDGQGRMIVPKQEFVAANGVKSVFGFGSGYATRPVLVTLFAFTNETSACSAAEPLVPLLDGYIRITERLVEGGNLFPA